MLSEEEANLFVPTEEADEDLGKTATSVRDVSSVTLSGEVEGFGLI